MKPTILYVIDTLETGGAEFSILEIASRLKGFRPVVCHIYMGETLKRTYQNKGIEVVSLNISKRYAFNLATQKLLALVRELKPSIIHSTLFRSDIVSRRVAKKQKIKLINSFVNNSYAAVRYDQLSLFGQLKLYLFQFYDRWNVGQVDLFISNSEAIKKSNARALNIEDERIEVIYRGRSPEVFDEVKESEIASVKNELNLHDKKVLLNVSRLLERKGQLDLIKAFYRYSKEDPSAILLIAGEGFFRTRLQKFIDENSLHGKVKLLGNRSDVPALLKASDLFLFPTYFEGLPGVLIEAMLAKIPIIATNIPENMECVNNEMAYTFNPGDIDGLVNSIREALKNDNDYAAQLAYKSAIAKFSISSVIDKYEETYQQLLSI